MVSLKKLIISATAVAAVNAQFGLGIGAIINQVSKPAIKVAMRYKVPGVPDVKATSEIQHAISVPVNYPAFKQLINKGIGVVMKGSKIDDALILGFMEDGIQAFNKFSKDAGVYNPYTAYVKNMLLDFDIKRGSAEAMSMVKPITGVLEAALDTLLADPRGKKMGMTGASLMSHIASDFGVQQYLTNVPQWKKYAPKLGIKV